MITTHLGITFNNGTKFHFWLDEEALTLGCSSGVTLKVSEQAAAFRLWSSDEVSNEEPPFKRLADAKQLFVLVEAEGDPVLRVRLNLSGVAEELASILASTTLIV